MDQPLEISCPVAEIENLQQPEWLVCFQAGTKIFLIIILGGGGVVRLPSQWPQIQDSG